MMLYWRLILIFIELSGTCQKCTCCYSPGDCSKFSHWKPYSRSESIVFFNNPQFSHLHLFYFTLFLTHWPRDRQTSRYTDRFTENRHKDRQIHTQISRYTGEMHTNICTQTDINIGRHIITEDRQSDAQSKHTDRHRQMHVDIFNQTVTY